MAFVALVLVVVTVGVCVSVSSFGLMFWDLNVLQLFPEKDPA